MKLKLSLFSLLAILVVLFGTQLPLNAKHDHSKSTHHKSQYKPKNIPGSWQPLTNTPPFGDPDTFPAAGFQLLLTDGSVLVQNINFPHTGEVWKLVPDINGSYVDGTWIQVASLPAGYAPYYFASAVLPDGRVILEGGEFNGPGYDQEFTNRGAIYDPVADVWTPVNPPEFFANATGLIPMLPIGDGASVVLPDGTFMLADALSNQAALLDAKTLTWTPTGFNKFDINQNEGWTLLPNGKVLTVDCNANHAFDDSFIPRIMGTELYDPATGAWTIANDTSVELSDFENTYTIGPQVLRPNGTVFVVGASRTGSTAIYNYCTGKWSPGPVTPFAGTGIIGQQPALIIDPPNGAAGTYTNIKVGVLTQVPFNVSGPIVPTVPANADSPCAPLPPGSIALIATDGFVTPTVNKGTNATNAGAIGCLFYDSTGSDFGSGSINGSPTVPSIEVDQATGQLLLDNLSGLTGSLTTAVVIGDIFFSAQNAPAALLPNGNVLFTVDAGSGPPTKFFEFDGTQLIEQQPVPEAEDSPAADFYMLILPTGQIMLTCDFTTDIEIYTPGDRTYNPDWAPVISKCPKKVKSGQTYKIEGVLFNGMSQGSMYGDDYQSATNYPLVRITNKETGHVFYARTHDHSFMGVASKKKVHTYFDVPANIELGKSILEVVANGIPSKPFHIQVK
ncbi:MAG: hypothetical protein JSR37_05370 [Verrucomicrobia bacterium]|nr:hypothetical protein [Verrucomicrobiota bacterium]MBS0636850.1 hypothetical protein [Verrucomicrobiota bacterium]